MSLVTASALLDRVRAGDPDLRICDVRWYLGQPGRNREAYAAGHLPGAIFVDLDTDLAAPRGPGRHPLPSPAAFTARMGSLGIGRHHDVVCYDDLGGAIAARLWWMLDNLGHPSVAVLDGGLQAWRDAGGELTAEEVAHPPERPELAGAWSRIIDRDALKERLGSVVLLDARAGERYRGEVEPVDPAAGHIPTARSLAAGGNLDAEGRFLPPAVLRERFGQAGCRGDGPEVVTSCGSGVTACHNALAMRVAGLPDPILYPGSFSDWARSGEPVTSGSEPGSVGAAG